MLTVTDFLGVAVYVHWEVGLFFCLDLFSAVLFLGWAFAIVFCFTILIPMSYLDCCSVLLSLFHYIHLYSFCCFFIVSSGSLVSNFVSKSFFSHYFVGSVIRPRENSSMFSNHVDIKSSSGSNCFIPVEGRNNKTCS